MTQTKGWIPIEVDDDHCFQYLCGEITQANKYDLTGSTPASLFPSGGMISLELNSACDSVRSEAPFLQGL